MNAGGLPLKDTANATVGGVGVAGAADDAVAVAYAGDAWIPPTLSRPVVR
jgi:uncharacterized protein GlcG (DUF336 family)